MKRAAKWLLLMAVVFCAATSVVMVDETEFAIVERLGRIQAVYATTDSRGAHFKLPWPIDSVRRFDSRIQLFDPPARELFTRDRKNITVDTFVCWKIAGAESPSSAINTNTSSPQSATLVTAPVVQFFRSLGSSEVAAARIDSQLRSDLTALVGQVELDALLNISNSEQGPSDAEGGPLAELSVMLRQSLQQKISPDLGIEIVDARIKRINFPEGNQQAVFDRMISERRKIADRYRAAGLAENEIIKSRADRRYHEILARAKSDAAKIRGDADARAIAILREAHAADPQFFEFVQTLRSYESLLSNETTLVLSASGRLFDVLLNGMDGIKNPPPTGAAADVQRDAKGSSDAADTNAADTESKTP